MRKNTVMTTTTTSQSPTETAEKQPGSLRVGVQKFGSFLSGMIMPIIPALIAWGIITAVVVNIHEAYGSWGPADALGETIGPMIHYLLPVLIAVQGGMMVYQMRGAVVGAVATFGTIAGSDWLLGEAGIHMFIGAMIMGPLSAWIMKQLDALWEGKIKAGFEMLVNMFSAGFLAFFMAVAGFFVLAPPINWLMEVLGNAVRFLVDNGLLPLTSLLIEPAKVFFLNNAINHGVLTPLGINEASGEAGKSVLFLLEANPGPGMGLLLAFTVFGVGAAKATAPGALIIQFFGGIHEVYFPYVLMKPALLLAVIGGGATGVTTNMLFDAGLRAPAAPGSIIAVYLQAATDSYLGVTFGWVLSAAVSFAIASLILLSSRKRDLAADDQFSQAVAKTQSAKGKGSSHLSNLAAGVPAAAASRIRTIYFACDAGMGSSAMGASVLRKKLSGAGLEDVYVTNKSIAALPGDADLVITQQTLTDRARPQEPDAIHVSVDNFMNAPEYDDVVELVKDSAEQDSSTGEETASSAASAGAGGTATAVQTDVLTADRVQIRAGAATQEQALAEANQILVAAGAVTQDYLQAMRDREATVSTFMGNELAIPHGTNEAKGSIKSSALSVVRYDGGVDWAGDQVTFVVGIAGIGDEHLQILSKIAELFADESTVARLKAAASEAELYDLLNAVNE